MADGLTCRTCGAALQPGTPLGHCARCLMELGWGGGPEPEPELEPSLAPISDGSTSPSTTSHRTFGDYELLEQIGRGGMGVVYKARQVSLNRVVALKMVLDSALASPQAVRRFQFEAEAAARLHHPNIVPIHEIGEHEGQHFFSMEFIPGESLAGAIARGEFRLTPDAQRKTQLREIQTRIARLLVQLCRAVHYAHIHGVLHRDLKPGNILLDAAGEPHLTDFGLAKRLANPELETQNPKLTLSGDILGTPAYMSPEQATARAVSPATDVYSLGAILYELLTGRPPFTGPTPLDILQQIEQRDPVDPTTTNGAVARDLAVISLKCLEKDPARRYVTASALADDLDRWLRGEPITARPSTSLERLMKWSRRRPALAALFAVIAAAALAFVTLILVNREQLKNQRNIAVAHARTALASERETRENLHAADVFLAQRALDAGNFGLARRSLEAHLPRPAARDQPSAPPTDLRGFEWHYLWQQCQGDQLAILRGHSNAVSCLAFSKDGRTLVSGGEDHTARFWDVETRALSRTLPTKTNALAGLAWLSRGRLLACAAEDGTVNVWDVQAQQVIYPFNIGRGYVSFSPISNRFAVALHAAEGQMLRVYRFSPARQEAQLADAGGRAGFAHDGQRLAAASRTGFRIWNLASGKSVLSVRTPERIHALVFSPDDRWLVGFGGPSWTARRWNAATGELDGEFPGHTGRILDAAFSPDGRTLATASADQTVRLWDMATRRETARRRGHLSEVRAVVFSPDGRLLATAGKDETVRLWSATPNEPAAEPARAFPPLVLSGDGRWLIAQDAPRFQTNIQTLRWNVTEGTVVERLELHPYEPLSFASDHATLLTLGRRWPDTQVSAVGELWFRPAADRRATNAPGIQFRDSRRTFTSTATSTDGNVVAIGAESGGVLLYDGATGGIAGHLDPQHPAPTVLKFSSDGKNLAAYHEETGARIWNVGRRAELARLEPLDRPVLDFAFSKDGSIVSTAGADNDIRLWETATGRERARLTGHSEPVLRVAFAPDGRTLASSSADGTVKLWSLAARREAVTLLKGEVITFLAFTPDGRTLIGGGPAGWLRFWRTTREDGGKTEAISTSKRAL